MNGNHITEIRIPYIGYKINEETLKPISNVNLFVGQNNSGKSRFLRELFKSDKIYDYKSITQSKLIELSKKLHARKISEFNNINSIGRENITKTCFNDISKDDEFHSSSNLYEMIEHYCSKLRNFQENDPISDIEHIFRKKIKENLNKFGNDGLEELNQIERPRQIQRFYVPILRGMRPFSENSQGEKINCYISRTKSDYFSDKIPDDQIFTGLELYKVLKTYLLGEPEQRKVIRDFEKLLSSNFFNNNEIALIPREDDHVVHIKIGDEKQYPIYKLGDGMQNLIILTFNAFIEKEHCLFFLEEPDLCMHPGMQRALINTLIKDLNRHQFFMTTHSNHLLDMTLDYNSISVFLFKKEFSGAEPNFSISNISSAYRTVLFDLGVQNSSVFLTNATIWVEGITDRLYLRAYMKKYIEEQSDKNQQDTLSKYKEDMHYSFFEYQGSNLVHWTFDNEDSEEEKIKATNLCAEALLIADGDIVTKGNRKEVFSEMLKEKFIVLDAKEIENYLPEEILREVVKEEFLKHAKSFDLVKYSDYSNKDSGLGEYLDDLLGKAHYSSETGTIKTKVDFCRKAVRVMESNAIPWNLTPQIIELCAKIFKHIKINNLNSETQAN